MHDVMLFCSMALTVLFVSVAIVTGAGRHKTYEATPKTNPPKPENTVKTLKTDRAQEIWNRLNPKVYLDDDETEPLVER